MPTVKILNPAATQKESKVKRASATAYCPESCCNCEISELKTHFTSRTWWIMGHEAENKGSQFAEAAINIMKYFDLIDGVRH